MASWFRPAIPCEDDYEVWTEAWHWIGLAHFEQWYPEEERVERFKSRSKR